MSSAVPLYRTEKRTTMKKCLLLLAVLSVAFTAGSARRCFMCWGPACRDPYTPNPAHEVNCPQGMDFCVKADLFHGEVERGCADLHGALQTSQRKEFKELQDRLAERQGIEIRFNFCNDRNLCNGSGRLAEISTMMILLPASLVLLISFFSKR